MLTYCSTLKQKVIFVSSPYAMDEDKQELMNHYTRMIRAAGFTMINFNTENTVKKLNLDWNRDFLDSGHVNYYGAEKFTCYMEKIMMKEANLPDHRSDPDYDTWKRAAVNLDKKLEKIKNSANE